MYKSVLLTGGAGFIGTNVLEALITNTNSHVTVLDNFYKRVDRDTLDIYSQKNKVRLIKDFSAVQSEVNQKIDLIIHLGAIASTDSTIPFQDVIECNVSFSQKLAQYAERHNIPVIYASSAAVYGNSIQTGKSKEVTPINLYGLSKYTTELIFSHLPSAIGMRLFNIYGMSEFHKGKMKSVPLAMYMEAIKGGVIQLFTFENPNFGGEPSSASRDFLDVKSLTNLILMFIQNGIPTSNEVFDVGSGTSLSLREVAMLVQEIARNSEIAEIPIPGNPNQYQKFTRANLEWTAQFAPQWRPICPEKGIREYLRELNKLKSLPEPRAY